MVKIARKIVTSNKQLYHVPCHVPGSPLVAPFFWVVSAARPHMQRRSRQITYCSCRMLRVNSLRSLPSEYFFVLRQFSKSSILYLVVTSHYNAHHSELNLVLVVLWTISQSPDGRKQKTSEQSDIILWQCASLNRKQDAFWCLCWHVEIYLRWSEEQRQSGWVAQLGMACWTTAHTEQYSKNPLGWWWVLGLSYSSLRHTCTVY